MPRRLIAILVKPILGRGRVLGMMMGEAPWPLCSVAEGARGREVPPRRATVHEGGVLQLAGGQKAAGSRGRVGFGT